jgi:uncharacterized protein
MSDKEPVSSQSSSKFRLLLLSSGLLIIWYAFDANLAETSLLKGVGIKDQRILSYILVALILFFLVETAFEYSRINIKPQWQSRFQYIFAVVFSLFALIFAYPKLVADTFLGTTSRAHLFTPIVAAIIAAVGIVSFRINLEVAFVFYKFRKRIFSVQIVWLTTLLCVSAAGVAMLLLLPSDDTIENFSACLLVFVITFFTLFWIWCPKKNIYTQSKLESLSKLSSFFDRQVEIYDWAKDARIQRRDSKKRLYKNVMKLIKKDSDNQRKELSLGFQMLRGFSFKTVGDYLEPETIDRDEKVLRVIVKDKKTNKAVKSTDVSFKYIQAACKSVKKPAGFENSEFSIQQYLTPLAIKAYSLQEMNEGNPDELLWRLADEGNLENLKKIIKMRKPKINHINEHGWSPLLIATANGHAETVKYLLQKAADPNLANKLGATPLSFAAWYGKETICKILITYGAKINHTDMEGTTPLMRAAAAGHSSTVKFLLDQGADPNIVDVYGKTALICSEEQMSGEIAALIRKHIKNKKTA